jgi:hypothetical protein
VIVQDDSFDATDAITIEAVRQRRLLCPARDCRSARPTPLHVFLAMNYVGLGEIEKAKVPPWRRRAV